MDSENAPQLTVVIADDSPTLRKIVGTVLERDGMRTVQAEDGVEAVQTVFRTQPDAVILDVQMPRVSGYVAARVLKDDWQTADIPVILLTSLDAATDRYWGALVGADRFLSKDFEAPQLVTAVRDVIAAADAARGGRARLVPDPVELGDDDVYARIGDLLDRKLFEAQVHAEVTSIASEVFGFEDTVATVLTVLGRVVDYDLAAVLPALEELDGFCSGSLLVDRASGRGVAAATFDNAEAMERNKDALDRIRATGSQEANAQVLDQCDFELAVAHLRVPEMA